MAQLAQWLWKQEHWLPPGVTWEDLQDTEEVRYPQPHHLLLCVPLTLVLTALRFFFERRICAPLSKKLGLREKVRQKPSPNPILEAFYRKWRKSPPKEEVNGLAKQCDLQPRPVERWFRYRLNEDRPSLTKKFCQASWRATYYIIAFCMGWAVLYDKPWFWDFRKCWLGYPKQPLQLSIFGYYIMQFSFYCSLLITLPFDVKQKDFHQQIVHHVVTIFLIGFSYCFNYIRIGSLILFVIDCSHYLLEAAKAFKYLKWEKTCETLFIAFSAIFLFTCMWILPFKILHNTWFYLMELYQPFFGYYFLSALLIIIQLLHVFWSYLIIHMFYQFLIHGAVDKDVRSESEGSEEEDELSQKSE
ncbi:ceramide synthase 4-like [Vipera latastei]